MKIGRAEQRSPIFDTSSPQRGHAMHGHRAVDRDTDLLLRSERSTRALSRTRRFSQKARQKAFQLWITP